MRRAWLLDLFVLTIAIIALAATAQRPDLSKTDLPKPDPKPSRCWPLMNNCHVRWKA